MVLKVTYENVEYCIGPFDTEMNHARGIYKFIEFFAKITPSKVYENGSRITVCGYNSTFIDIKHERSTKEDIELYYKYHNDAALYTRNLFAFLAVIEAEIPKNKCIVTDYDNITIDNEYLRYPGTGIINLNNRIERYSDDFIHSIHIGNDGRITIQVRDSKKYVLSFIFIPLTLEYSLTLDLFLDMFEIDDYELIGDNKALINKDISSNAVCTNLIPLYNKKINGIVKSARK